jgi:alpha-1,6-mannosyltransferase
MDLRLFFGLCCYIVGIAINLFISSQQEFLSIIQGYSLSFIGVCFIAQSDKKRIIEIVVLLVMLLAVVSFPRLSDDIYRFYWDGILLQNGISPYSILPSELIKLPHCPTECNEIFPLLNSPNYHSIYTPLNQAFFRISALIGSITGFSIVMKMLYLLIHLSSFFALRKLVDFDKMLFYFANPLVIIEGLGNLHAEIIVMALMAWVIYFVYHQKLVKATLSFMASFSFKLLPVMLLPYLAFWSVRNKKIKLFVIGFFLSFVTLGGLFIGLDFKNFMSSIDLYFRKFEFNASIYYLLRGLGQLITGYNTINVIGPIMSFSTVGIVLYFSTKFKQLNVTSLAFMGILSYTIYLCLATTVHPWYLISLLFFAQFFDFKFPILWSYVCTWSYHRYWDGAFKESYWLIAFSYMLVLIIAIFERKKILAAWTKLTKPLNVNRPNLDDQ